VPRVGKLMTASQVDAVLFVAVSVKWWL
jgi:hypothetical protein